MKAALRLRVVPNARRSEVVGVYGDAIKVKVQAPAVEGRANEVLREFVAGLLEVPLQSVEIIAGKKSRDKIVAIGGWEAEEARRRLLGKS